jgi:4-hydroxybenzoate polyprenyltransferase
MNFTQLQDYLQLIRIPNIFTVPSNVLVGYFALSDVATVQVLGLASASILLYVSGIVLNDYFDFEKDKKSRPNRPVAAGRISRRRAAQLGILTIVAGNLVALVVAGISAFCVSIAISAVIFAYDYRLKSSSIRGIAAMAGARFLNVLLGASPAFAILFMNSVSQTDLHTLAVASISLFLYITSIMILSRAEEHGASLTRRFVAMSIVFATVISVVIFGLSIGWEIWFLAVISLFTAVLSVTFLRYHKESPQSTQKTIRNMILSIIIFDAVFLTGTVGLYGLLTLLLLPPAAVLGKKMYVT